MSDDIEQYKKHDILFFHQYGVKIFTIIGSTKQYENLPNVLIDPDYSLVRGIPPHHWCINNGELGILDQKERAFRDEFYKKNKFENPKVITIEVTKEVQVEKIKEVPVNINTTRIVRQYKVPKWVYASHAVLILIIFILLLKGGF